MYSGDRELEFEEFKKMIDFYKSESPVICHKYNMVQAYAYRYLCEFLRQNKHISDMPDIDLPEVSNWELRQTSIQVVVVMHQNANFWRGEYYFNAGRLRVLLATLLCDLECKNMHLLEDEKIRNIIIDKFKFIPDWWLKMFGPKNLSWMKNPLLEEKLRGRLHVMENDKNDKNGFFTVMYSKEISDPVKDIFRIPIFTIIKLTGESRENRKKSGCKLADFYEPKLTKTILEFSGLSI